MAVGCVLVSAAAGCSSGSSVDDPSIPGIGATRHDWDASHMPNPNFNNGMVYGDDPSLPYPAVNGAVYIAVFDNDITGTKRIAGYILNMPTADRDGALARVRQELPSDATVAWELTLDRCYRVAFDSARLKAVTDVRAIVQLEDVQQGGKSAPNPHSFNQANFVLAAVGAPPTTYIDC